MPKHDWKKFFPYENVRPGQDEAINSILDAFEAGKHYFILEAGTGVGKSAIAITVARYIENYFQKGDDLSSGTNILTTQKLLQTQYRKDYPEINSLKSSSNYFHSSKVFMECSTD